MKYIWEEKDINCGRIVCKNVKFEPTDGWQAKWTRRSKQDMANYLSNEGMISMPHENFIKLMDVFQKGNYES